MSDEFLDNQIVTAADMNNIAIDLGYSDYSHFPETPPQSAVSALNQITSDLVSKGVLILGNKCNVTASGGTAYVDTGVIVFDSGAKKRIEAVQSLSLTAGSINYIYAINDTVNNTIELVCSTEEPSTGDFVMLAKIKGDVVTDRRKFAESRLFCPTLYSCVKKTVEIKNGVSVDFGRIGFSRAYVFYNGGNGNRYYAYLDFETPLNSFYLSIGDTGKRYEGYGSNKFCTNVYYDSYITAIKNESFITFEGDANGTKAVIEVF